MPEVGERGDDVDHCLLQALVEGGQSSHVLDLAGARRVANQVKGLLDPGRGRPQPAECAKMR